MDNTMKNKDSNSKYYIHPEGWKFALIFFVLSFLVSLIYAPIAFIGYLLTLCSLSGVSMSSSSAISSSISSMTIVSADTTGSAASGT